MNIKETDRRRYSNYRQKLLEPGDPYASENFLSEEHLFGKYQTASETYVNDLRGAIENKGQFASDAEVYNLHRKASASKSYLNSILPRDQMLSSALKLDQIYCKSWIQPENHPNYVWKSLTAHQVSLVNFNQNDFEMQVNQFRSELRAQQNFIFHATPVPFSLESVNISKKAYNKIFKNRGDMKEYAFKTSLDPENGISVPTRLTIGGSSNAMSFTFGLSESRKSENQSGEFSFLFSYTKIPHEVCEFLTNLPSIYSVNAKKQIDDLEKFLNDIYDVSIRFHAFDLKALAIASGCKMDSYDLNSLSIITTGNAFPVGIEKMDSTWMLAWEDLPNCCHLYLAEKLLRMYSVYNVLMGLLLRNIFPDPDCVLEVTEMSQQSFTAWFTEFVGYALSKANVSEPVNPDHSRKELIRSLGSAYIPILDLADLIIKVPVISCGGERYLHHARACFISQYEVIKNIRLNNYPGDPPNRYKNVENFQKEILYNRPMKSSLDDYDLPANGIGLLASPTFQSTLFKLDVDFDDVSVLRPQFDCPIEPTVLEWGRLNTDSIPALFARLRRLSVEELSYFWLEKACLYENLKAIYHNVTGLRVSVPELEESLLIRKENVQLRYDETTAKRIMQNQILRSNLLKRKSHRTDFAQRASIHQSVYGAIPGDFTERNKRIEEKRKLRRDKLKLVKKDQWLTKRQFKQRKRLAQLRDGGVSAPIVQRYDYGYSRDPRIEVNSQDLRYRCSEHNMGSSSKNGRRSDDDLRSKLRH